MYGYQSHTPGHPPSTIVYNIWGSQVIIHLVLTTPEADLISFYK